MTLTEMTRVEEVTLLTLLRHRFPDGRIYPQSREDRAYLKQAIRLGLVDPDYFPTPSGEEFLRSRSTPEFAVEIGHDSIVG